MLNKFLKTCFLSWFLVVYVVYWIQEQEVQKNCKMDDGLELFFSCIGVMFFC